MTIAGQEFFVGPEFDWLAAQVGAVLWRSPARVKVLPKTLTVSSTSPMDAFVHHWEALTRPPVPTVTRATKAQEAEYRRHEREHLAALERARQQDAALKRIAATSKGELSVSEYNEMRSIPGCEAAPYIRQEYPAYRYKKGQEPTIVSNAHEDEIAQKQGWKDTPQ